MKKLIIFVNPGTFETLASDLLPESMFSSDDLPTFERPINANSGMNSGGALAIVGALVSKLDDVISITQGSARLHPMSKSGLGESEPKRIVGSHGNRSYLQFYL
ncbi:MAG: hypothetical protein JWN25_2212 [Verrucomicrobiales bacterium]|nr:hypothetical protein [Verrucomicrobiales bacterium]MDB6130002.1 hypothetical protein [Verrucomicrobiales bacterium]